MLYAAEQNKKIIDKCHKLALDKYDQIKKQESYNKEFKYLMLMNTANFVKIDHF